VVQVIVAVDEEVEEAIREIPGALATVTVIEVDVAVFA